MSDSIFDLFDFNNDGHLDFVEEAMAYTTLFGTSEPETSLHNDFHLFAGGDYEPISLSCEDFPIGLEDDLFDDDEDEFGLGFLFHYEEDKDEIEDEDDPDQFDEDEPFGDFDVGFDDGF